ncbi:heavy metal transporter [Hanstruepera neustonica]|uniref:Heavy metal transporter n=1 Tax=Hanstruepera neustonica TaxID=1445657 RepID=A0A2K1E4I5_9FLAO|nr:heavy metal-associated domain-containing protein [Hanstruepera neustonica]PNQ75194.1 heavy metal transporter [Hanstruepera neustonica]
MNAAIVIQNLKCGGCANTVKNKLSEIEGLQDIHVDIDNSVVAFQYSLEEQLTKAKDRLKAIGYPEQNAANSMITKAKSYISCATGKMAKS